MAIELVDGFAGHPHISSEDLAALNKGTIGAKDCVFDYGDKFKCTMETANKAVVGTGAGMVGGLRFWSKSSTDLTVQSGSQGMKRHDLVVARYKKDPDTQIESVALEVVKGTPHASSPADPAVGADGMALWRIPIDGITPGAPVMVANVTPSIQALRDSVSQDTGFIALLGKLPSSDATADNNGVWYRRVGYVVWVGVLLGGTTGITVDQQFKTLATLPVGCRPRVPFFMPAWTPGQASASTQVRVLTDGSIQAASSTKTMYVRSYGCFHV